MYGSSVLIRLVLYFFLISEFALAYIFYLLTLAVDVGCRDIDDALHCTPLPNGNFEVGVRIFSLVYLCVKIIANLSFPCLVCCIYLYVNEFHIWRLMSFSVGGCICKFDSGLLQTFHALHLGRIAQTYLSCLLLFSCVFFSFDLMENTLNDPSFSVECN